MNYDTWKTTDFEGEAQAEEEEAIEKAQIELADALFDAYLADNEKVVQEVHEVLTSVEEETQWMLTSMRAGLKLDCRKPINERGSDSYWRWQSIISGACTHIAGKEDTLSKIDDVYGSYEL